MSPPSRHQELFATGVFDNHLEVHIPPDSQRLLGVSIGDTLAGTVVVTEVCEPAASHASAPLHIGDVLLKVQGVPVVGRSAAIVASMLRSVCNMQDKVTLTLASVTPTARWSCPLCSGINATTVSLSDACPYFRADSDGGTHRFESNTHARVLLA
jgi:hypothetical protein